MRSLIPFLEYHFRPFPGFTLAQPFLDALSLREWKRTGNPPPPRRVKADIIRGLAASNRRVLVETGTFYGDTLALLKDDFEEIHSIELSPCLVRRARRRFSRDPSIRIHEGNSGDLLANVLRELQRPAVLWLDGHYSGPLTARGESDTPLLSEIEAALTWGTPEDVILVDDARLLGTDPAYPTTEEISRRIRAARTDWTTSIQSDVFCAGRL